jgi:Mg/Co/Ni transporter MgtE
VLQSASSFIISRNEALLQSHLVIVQFLTMLVGAGGNAGNQASVRGACVGPPQLLLTPRALRFRGLSLTVASSIDPAVIRGLATGTVNDRNARTFLLDEIKMGVALSALLGAAGFARAAAFAVPPPETLAITASLSAIVFLSIVLGAVLPLAMSRMRIDPAHSSTTIQVLMDILGVTITVGR